MKLPWEVVVSLGPGKKFPTFKHAFTYLYREVKKMVSEGKMALVCLERGTWIKDPSGAPLMFYRARDMAVNQGLLKNGELVDPDFKTDPASDGNLDRKTKTPLEAKSRVKKKIQVQTRLTSQKVSTTE